VSRILQEHWRVTDAAEAARVPARTASKCLAHFRASGEPMLHDRSSEPARKPRTTPAGTIAPIE